MDDDELLAELEGAAGPSVITELRHVRTSAEKRAAEEIANRERCEDFDSFRPLFKQIESELKADIRQTRPFGKDASVDAGNFFILSGQLVYVAEKGEDFQTPNGHMDARLRVIYANGTESNLLLRSLQRALYKDETGRRLTEPNLGPLFSETWEEDDIESGTIYVLRSLSNHPLKMNVTGNMSDGIKIFKIFAIQHACSGSIQTLKASLGSHITKARRLITLSPNLLMPRKKTFLIVSASRLKSFFLYNQR